MTAENKENDTSVEDRGKNIPIEVMEFMIRTKKTDVIQRVLVRDVKEIDRRKYEILARTR